MKKRGLAKAPAFSSAQASVEYLMVVGLVFAIMVPAVYIFYSYSSEVSEGVTESKLVKIGDDLTSAAEEVFYLGEPSKRTVKFDMPAGVIDIEVSPNKNEMVFRTGDYYSQKEIISFSNVKMDSLLIPIDYAPGRHSITVQARESDVVLYSGRYEEAVILSAIYNDFVRILMDYARASQQELIKEGVFKEENPQDIAYAYESFDKGLSASIDLEELNGNLNILIGSSNLRRGIDNDNVALLNPLPSVGITLEESGNLYLYYLKDLSPQQPAFSYYDSSGSESSSKSPLMTGLNTGSALSADINEVNGNSIGIKIIAGGQTVTHIIPYSILAGDRTNWIIGDISRSTGYIRGKLEIEGPYAIYSEGAYLDRQLTFPYRDGIKLIDDISLGGTSITVSYIDDEEMPQEITFDSFVSVNVPSGKTFTIPYNCPIDPSSCTVEYRFVNKGSYVEVYDKPQ
ncbi:hypothetical protein COV19_04940 [Candidatus Woesearchaeota archaeon CG10_big_fil_rev_8_21_14_0_10_44_13]|nr:MAG: hypothetical protein COV19_04940 [Candidatus Woesearchaeota archaeon CG10_big_fil_rev_8_21_14_0_10_44_13]